MPRHPILATAPSLDAVEPLSADHAVTLDIVWRELSALGGYFDPTDREATVRDAMLGQCLDVIERMGGRDPLERRREAAADLGLVAAAHQRGGLLASILPDATARGLAAGMTAAVCLGIGLVSASLLRMHGVL